MKIVCLVTFYFSLLRGIFCILIDMTKASSFKFYGDFFATYSPERINPCDKLHLV